MLRNSADIRTVAYMIVASLLLVLNWNWGFYQAWYIQLPLFLWACFMGVTASVMAHNHNHLPMWKNGVLNKLTDYWITLFYGFPVFAWVPTHNANHHRFTNKPGDHTATWRLFEANNLFTVVTYPALSSWWQRVPTSEFLAKQWANNKPRFFYCMSQYAVLAAWVGAAMVLDWRKALLYVVAPGVTGLFTVLVFNYVQHIHADEMSEWNHSRNIVGPGLNILLFNNGYHTIHHVDPNLHWSELPEAHAAIAHHIDPELNERSFWWMIAKFYLLGPFVPSLRSRNMRAERLQHEGAAAAK